MPILNFIFLSKMFVRLIKVTRTLTSHLLSESKCKMTNFAQSISLYHILCSRILNIIYSKSIIANDFSHYNTNLIDSSSAQLLHTQVQRFLLRLAHYFLVTTMVLQASRYSWSRKTVASPEKSQCKHMIKTVFETKQDIVFNLFFPQNMFDL